MALSNKLGPMVLTTGNKSEMAVGYATLYGDMCGGYNVLKDVYKTERLRARPLAQRSIARGRRRRRPRIPERIITKPPSAELRPDQKDQDSLPPYEVLDAHPAWAGRGGGDAGTRSSPAASIRDTVERVCRLLYLAEYKRRQAPPGVKIARKAFGRDRRYPIVNGFRRVGLRDLPA